MKISLKQAATAVEFDILCPPLQESASEVVHSSISWNWEWYVERTIRMPVDTVVRPVWRIAQVFSASTSSSGM